MVSNDNITIEYGRKYSVSHCSYCSCQNSIDESPQLVCYATQDHKSFDEICSNCTTLPKSNCSYCLQPHKRSSTEIILKGQGIKIERNDCVSCTCTGAGVVRCDDLDTSITDPVCLGLDQCEQKLNKLPEKPCQYCEDPLTGLWKRSPSQWENKPEITCHCSKGQVSCHHFSKVSVGKGIFPFMTICKPNCTRDEYKAIFVKRGRYKVLSTFHLIIVLFVELSTCERNGDSIYTVD